MTEVVYFFTLFIARFIPFIYYEPTRVKCGRQTQQFYHLVLSTFLRWLDSVLFIFVGSSLTTAGSCTPQLLPVLLPATSSWLSKHELLDDKILPRKVRRSGGRPTIVDNLIRASIPKTQRLLKSLNELEREVSNSMTIPDYIEELRGLVMIFSRLEQTI